MKKLLLIFGICLVLLVLAGLIWLRYGSGTYIGSQLEEYSRKYTGASLEIQEKPEVRFFPPYLLLKGLAWHSANGQQSLSARSLKIAPDLASFMTGVLKLDEVIIESPVFRINLESSSEEGNSPPGMQPDISKNETNKGLPVEINRLIIQKGKLEFQKTGEKIRLGEANLSAENLRLRQEATISGDFIVEQASGMKEDVANFAGNLAFRGKARFYDPNLTIRQGTITFTATKNDVLAWLSPLRLNMDGAFDLQTREMRLISSSLDSAQGNLAFKGTANWARQELAGNCTLTLELAKILAQESRTGASDSLVIDSPLRFAANTLSLSEIIIKSGMTEGVGQLVFRLPNQKNESSLEGALDFRKLVLWGTTKDRQTPQNGPKTNAPSSKPPFENFPALNLRLGADEFQYGSFMAKNASAKLKGESGIYELLEGEFDWADGKVNASGLANFKDSLFRLKSSWAGQNAGLAFKECGFSGFTGGIARFNANLSSGGLDLDSLRSSLAGNADFYVKDVKINLLEKILAFMPAGIARIMPDEISLFSADLQARNGQLSIDPLKLDAKNFAASGKAGYQLRNGEIAGELDIKLGTLALPLLFQGTGNKLSWNVKGGLLKQLFRDLP